MLQKSLSPIAQLGPEHGCRWEVLFGVMSMEHAHWRRGAARPTVLTPWGRWWGNRSALGFSLTQKGSNADREPEELIEDSPKKEQPHS